MARTKKAITKLGLPGEAQEDQNLVASVAIEVRKARDEGGYQTMYKIGGIVLERMFEGSIEKFLASEKSHASFRALAKSAETGVSASNLWYSVAMHENARLLGEDAQKLHTSQHRLLAHVKDKDQRIELGQRAIAEQLTVRQLDDIIRSTDKRAPEDPKLGRPALPAPLKQMREMARAASKVKEAWPKSLANLDANQTAEVTALARQMHESLGEWMDLLDRESVS